MSATLQDLERWFDYGVNDGYSHMIVVYDTYDMENYPVYAKTDTEARDKCSEVNDKSMQRIDEIYDLNIDKVVQMKADRVLNLPTG